MHNDNMTFTMPEMEILAASSAEQLLEEVQRATARGFRPHGTAHYEGHNILPYRQAMVREEEEATTWCHAESVAASA